MTAGCDYRVRLTWGADNYSYDYFTTLIEAQKAVKSPRIINSGFMRAPTYPKRARIEKRIKNSSPNRIDGRNDKWIKFINNKE